MLLILLPGMDGTGRLFGPLLGILPPGLEAAVVAYPPDRPCGYAELLPIVEAAVPDEGEFLILGESFSGPLALLLAARRPRGLRGVILCASFARSPLPSFARWFRYLIRSFWFRAVPWSLIRRGLLGRFETISLRRMVEDALGAVEPSVLAARARAILAVDVGRSCDRAPSRFFISRLRRIAWYPEGAWPTSGVFSRESMRWPWWVRICSSKLRRRWRPG
jgi:pimeloyl-ACP methyl ester carboxylesterase